MNSIDHSEWIFQHLQEYRHYCSLQRDELRLLVNVWMDLGAPRTIWHYYHQLDEFELYRFFHSFWLLYWNDGWQGLRNASAAAVALCRKMYWYRNAILP